MVGQKGDVDIQVDVVLPGTTAPAGFLAAEGGSVIRQIEFFMSPYHAGKGTVKTRR